MIRSVWTQVWITLVVATVLLAFYTSLGRQLVPLIETQKPALEELLTGQLGVPVKIDELLGEWNLLSPVFKIRGVSIGVESQDALSFTDDSLLTITQIDAELDISASAFYLAPVFKRIVIDGVSAPLRQDDDGELFLGEQSLIDFSATDLENPKPLNNQDRSTDTPAWLEWLGYQQAVVLSNWTVTNQRSSGAETLLVRKVLWRNRGEQHSLEGDVAWGREEIADIYVGAELRGPLWPWSDQDGEVYVSIDEQQWTRWIPDDLPRELKVPTLRGRAEGWLSITDGDLNSLYVKGHVPELTLDTPEKNLVLTEGELLVSGERIDDDWHLSIQPEFKQNIPLNEVRLSSVQLSNQRGWQVGVPNVDLEEFSDFILDYNVLPERFSKYFTNLKLRGTASDVRVTFVPGMEGGVDIRSDVAGLSLESYIGIPQFKDADGRVHLQRDGGVAYIDDPSLSMKIEGVYDPVWDLTDASARFFWSIEPELFNLRLVGLDAGLDGARVYGDLAIRVPRRDTDVEYHMALMLGIEQADIGLQKLLVPDMLDPAINQWLDEGLVEGKVSNVGFILNGHTGSDIPPNSLTTQLYLEADNARIDYLEDWPSVTNVHGRVFLNSPDLDAWIDSAETLGGTIASGARLRLRDTQQGTRLSLSGNINGQAADAIGYLQTTPLAEMVDNALADWSVKGEAATDISLSMILGRDDAVPDVDLSTQLKSTHLTLTDSGLNLNGINGKLAFNSATGLTAKDLSVDLFGGRFTADVRSQKIGESYRIFADGEGSAQWTHVKKWLDLFLLDPVKGELNYQARFEVNPELASPVNLLIESDLVGTTIDLPAPMGKTNEQPRTLTTLVSPGNTSVINLNYDSFMQLAMRVGEQGVETGEVVFGGDNAKLTDTTGIAINGNIPTTLSVEKWWDVWDRMMLLLDQESASGSSSGATYPKNSLGNNNPVSSVNLTIAGLNAWDIPVSKTSVTGKQAFNEWTMKVDNDLARGSVIIREDTTAPVVLLMDYVHLPETDTPESPDTDAVLESSLGSDRNITSDGELAAPIPDPLEDIIPADVAELDITIDELYYGTRNFGRWKATTRPIPSGLTLNLFDSDMKGLTLKGRLDWIMREGQHATRMTDFTMSAKNVENIQKAFRLQPVVQGKELDGGFSLDWIGSPAGVNAKSLNGNVNFRIRNGVVNAEGAGALKAFGALNFNSIFRRMRLDFSDLVGSGMAFDTMKGKANIEQGLLTLSEPITVDGPGGKFATSGTTDLNTGELDMKLAVTFPVTSTLPLVAVLAGFAPPVAASIYVTERLIGDELERFTSASYNITGTWEKPEVKLNKAFDNDVDGKSSRGFMDRVLSIFGLGGD